MKIGDKVRLADLLLRKPNGESLDGEDKAKVYIGQIGTIAEVETDEDDPLNILVQFSDGEDLWFNDAELELVQ